MNELFAIERADPALGTPNRCFKVPDGPAALVRSDQFATPGHRQTKYVSGADLGDDIFEVVLRGMSDEAVDVGLPAEQHPAVEKKWHHRAGCPTEARLLPRNSWKARPYRAPDELWLRLCWH